MFWTAAFTLVFAGLLAFHPSVSADVMGTLGLLLFGFVTWVGVVSLRQSWALVLSDDGLSYGPFGNIPWSEIAFVCFRERRFRGTSIWLVELVLHEKYVRGKSGTARVLGMVNRAFGYSPVCISLNQLQASAETIGEAMRLYAPGLKIVDFEGNLLVP